MINFLEGIIVLFFHPEGFLVLIILIIYTEYLIIKNTINDIEKNTFLSIIYHNIIKYGAKIKIIIFLPFSNIKKWPLISFRSKLKREFYSLREIISYLFKKNIFLSKMKSLISNLKTVKK